MKRSVTAALILALFASSLAMADPGKGRHNPHDRRHEAGEHRYSDSRSHYGHRGRYEAPRHYERYRVGEYRRPAHYRAYQWRRGERLPAAYYARPYRIHDYHRYRLRTPPRGYHWVRVDHDAVLAAIATGLVLDVILDSFY